MLYYCRTMHTTLPSKGGLVPGERIIHLCKRRKLDYTTLRKTCTALLEQTPKQTDFTSAEALAALCKRPLLK
jgi:hypothetical protein